MTARFKPRRLALGIIALALAAGGCSSTDEFFSEQPPPRGGSSSFTERFTNLFGGGGSSRAQPEVASAPAEPGTTTLTTSCPPTDIRRGAGTLQMTAPGGEQAMDVRFQATFGRTARQCTVRDGTLNIKVGVQGRLILGPAGKPGETQVPLRYALVQEGTEPKTIWTKLYMVPVSIPPDRLNVAFTHVMEEMAVPMPSSAELDRYIVYVGFDPKGAAQENPRRRR